MKIPREVFEKMADAAVRATGVLEGWCDDHDSWRIEGDGSLANTTLERLAELLLAVGAHGGGVDAAHDDLDEAAVEQPDTVCSGGDEQRPDLIDHCGDVAKNVDNAKKLTGDLIAAMNATGETFSSMARRRMTPAEVITYIESVFPADKDGKVTDSQAERRASVAELVWTGRGAELAMSNTDGDPNPWAVFNAVTAYFDHLRQPKSNANSTASADRSALFGTGADIKLLALQKAYELVAA